MNGNVEDRADASRFAICPSAGVTSIRANDTDKEDDPYSNGKRIGSAE